jgi:SAM-dependent methyltransferase
MAELDQEKIEILSVALLDQHRDLVEELRRLSDALRMGLGWHYLLDLSWIISQLGSVNGKHILDAGAGVGLMQWYLAGKGVEVISVDRSSRADLPLFYRGRYRVKGLRSQDLEPAGRAWLGSLAQANGLSAKLRTLARGALDGGRLLLPVQSSGQVLIYNQDLSALVDISDNTLDAVVAVSALEHNPPESLGKVVAELMRVLKPGGVLLATLGAGRDQDWFHQSSQGWCYTAASLRRLFDLREDVPTNYDQYDRLFEELIHCNELRDHLAAFYFRSGDNGMPWGKWDPQYPPVGVCKVKR